MADDATGARALIELALASYRKDLMPSLPASKRYVAAMVANALEIALRDFDDLTTRSETELLDAVLPDGDMTGLAAAIRSGAVSDEINPDLRTRLLAHIVAELEVRNPRFLADWQQ